ncbi:L,D-transpeptidase [Micromonospora endophytica]|uniref:L,D-transpeptidase n=1 Tax=Micromonospora endophytica TaxID=515350 RepID=UPI0020171ACC|nr:L,D-transpeptidase [Micromonospora endophytica]
MAVLVGGAAYGGWALTLAPETTPTVRPDDGVSRPISEMPASHSPEAGDGPAAAPAPDWLPEIDYDPAPAGFPADPDTLDTTPLTEGVRPARRLAAYDAPGGRPLAFLMPTIRGVELTVPIARRERGWTAVLLPSANRRLAWLPPGGFRTVALRDQIVVERVPYRLTWYHDGEAKRSWRLSLGQPGQETPLGRTFILGRTPPLSRSTAAWTSTPSARCPTTPRPCPPACVARTSASTPGITTVSWVSPPPTVASD